MSKQQIAEAWCTNGAQWRTVKHRYGVQGSGLVRVARMPPEECMEEVLAYLTSAAGCTGLFLDGKPLSDRFLPLSAWYERTTAANRVETVEVYHALRDKDDAEAFGPVSVRNGCTYLEEHTFYWAVAALPTVPASTSGVNYSLESIRRDEESGLYSCVLVKRTRVQVNVDAYLSHDDQMSERSTAQMLGVRVTEKLVDGNSALDEHGNPMMNTVDEQLAAFATGQGLKTEGGTGGVVVDIQKTKNDDCTTDVTIHNTEEQTVEAAEKTETEDRYSKTTRTVNRSAESAEGLPTWADGTIARVTNVKTPGGLVDVTTEKTEAKQNVESGNSEVRTIFETRKTEDKRNATSEAAAENPFSGTLKQVENVYNPDGTINTRVTTTNEQPVATAEQTLTEDRYSKTTRTVDRNIGSAGTLPSTLTTGTIKRVANVKTPGNLYNVTTETTEAKPSAGGTGIESGNSEVRTQFEIRTTEDKRNATTELSPADAGNGKVTQVENVYNPDGTINTRKTETTEQNVANAEVVHEINALQTVERVLNRGQSGALTHLTTQVSGAVTRHRTVKTPGKLHDTETTTTTAKAASFSATMAEDHNGVKRTIVVFRNYTHDAALALIQNAHTGSASPNEFGLYDGSCTTTTEPDEGRRAKARRDYREYHESRTGKDIRIVNANGKTYKVTEEYTYVCGVLHDNDPTATSTQSAYYQVNGCANPKVQYLGDGYWSYYGITNKTITWEAVDGSETITHSM